MSNTRAAPETEERVMTETVYEVGDQNDDIGEWMTRACGARASWLRRELPPPAGCAIRVKYLR